jgi:Zn-dependent peptidase ImmA (M78 family)/transcriptional regulator with XRE-family HTH domain
MIFGSRVKEARDLRGLTQTQLAEIVGVSHSAIALIESGKTQEPRHELIEGIAGATGFPLSFFEDDDETEFPAGSLLFRARSDMLMREEAEARAWGGMVFRRVNRLAQRMRIPPVTLPRLVDVAPDEAAAYARAALGLSPDGPIAHLINAAERAGVLVLALPVEMPRRDAFSVWAGNESLRPVIVIVDGVPGDRLRFSVAHELGHLVMHQSRPVRIQEIENEAGAFAEAFLMPEDAIRGDFDTPVTLTKLAALKPRWGVSIQALVRRAFTLGVISKRQYHYLFQQLTVRGWRINEPENLAVAVERPRAVRKMIEVAYGERPDYIRVAEDLRLFPHQARQLVSGYADRSQLPRSGSVGEPRIVQFRQPALADDHSN